MRFRPLLAAPALLAGAALSGPLGAQSTVPLAPFGPGRMRTVSVVVANDTLDFLFDTGGGVTVISPALAARLGCTPAGRLTGYRMLGQRLESPVCRDVALQVGGVSARRDAAVMELQPYGPDGPRVDGMVSLHTLAPHALTVDMAAGRLTVETPASLARRVRGMTPLRARLATGLEGGELDAYVGVPVGPAEAWLLWDSNHGGPTFVAPWLATLLGADSAGGAVDAALALGPGAPVRTPVQRQAALIHDGVLGGGLVARAEWTIDLAGGRLWVGDVRPLLEPPADAAAQASAVPPTADPAGWYDLTLVVGGERQAAVVQLTRTAGALAGRARFLGDDAEHELRDVRADGDRLEFGLPLRRTYPVRLTFAGTTGQGTWGDPATRGGRAEARKRR
jgi:hypothetical protein